MFKCLICEYQADNILGINLHFRENHWDIYVSTQESIWSYINEYAQVAEPG